MYDELLIWVKRADEAYDADDREGYSYFCGYLDCLAEVRGLDAEKAWDAYRSHKYAAKREP